PASGSERLLFPIPAAALAVNPNLEQNPGYR
ncbi:MAG: SusD family, partial [Bacteroidota bacterium]